MSELPAHVESARTGGADQYSPRAAPLVELALATPMTENDDETHILQGNADPATPVDPDRLDDQAPDPLTACEEAVQELKAENAELRESAESFGALAERLNRAKRSDDA